MPANQFVSSSQLAVLKHSGQRCRRFVAQIFISNYQCCSRQPALRTQHAAYEPVGMCPVLRPALFRERADRGAAIADTGPQRQW